MTVYYAGIGSRKTPGRVLSQMEDLARWLGDRGCTLRSGGAPGADTAFEDGLRRHHPREIYLPWAKFNGHDSRLHNITVQALALAATHHPNWRACRESARRLHARNGYQVLGQDLNTPSSFIVCWTFGGHGGGGTGQAIRIARAHGIDVYDLALFNVATVKKLIDAKV